MPEPEREPEPGLPTNTTTNSDEHPHTPYQSTHNQPPSQPIPIPTSTPIGPRLHPLSAAATTTTTTTTTRPTPHQLSTITSSQLHGIRLLYPGLRDVPAPHLREAIYAHRRYLVMQKLRACGDVRVAGPAGPAGGERGGGGATGVVSGGGMGPWRRPPPPPPPPPTGTYDVARYRAVHPDLDWASDGGVRASMLFDGERAAWLREGWVVEMSGHGTGTGTGGRVLRRAEPKFEPSDEELREFRAQCESVVRIGDPHVRSVVAYLRRRQWRREGEMEDGVGVGLGMGVLGGRREVETLAVPVEVIRRRIGELRRVAGVDRANVLRAQELQRLLEVERARRLETSDGYRAEGGTVDRGVQTMVASLQMQELTALPPVEAVEEGEVNDEESDTDGGIDLDEGSHYSGETNESEDYRDYDDLFEEIHGRLI